MSAESPKFIVDQNVGKLAKWLRLMGFDTIFFEAGDDSRLVSRAVAEGRILLTRDTEIAERRLARTGRLCVLVLSTEDPAAQIRQVVEALHLDRHLHPFTRCLEDNSPLAPVEKEQVRELVPPYVFKTQDEFVQCPACRRIYWKGTHWAAMVRRLAQIAGTGQG